MLKLFCHNCHKFMKEVLPIKAGSLTGMEICKDCLGVMEGELAEVKKVGHRARLAIKKKEDKAVADLELIMLKVMKGE